MTSNDDRLIDPFIDWLDAYVAGMSTPATDAEADPELSDICTAARQIHGLDARLGQYAVSVSPRTTSWEDLMSAHPGALEPFGAGATDQPASPSTVPNVVVIRPWERALNALLIAAVVIALAAGFWRAADNFGFGNGSEPPDDRSIPFGGMGPQDDDGDTNALVPVATVPVDMETSSIPYPTPDECLVEPMTREEVIQHLQMANVATEPERAFYERGIEPSEEDAAAIMRTFREWQACGLSGRAPAYQMQFESVWYAANQTGLFYDRQNEQYVRPVSDEVIEDWADIVVTDEADQDLGTPTPATGTLPSLPVPPARVPLPEDATPIMSEPGRTFFPTIFPEDIVITSPDTAVASVFFVDPETREVSVASGQLTYGFVKVDGQWLIDTYREGLGG